MQNWIFRFGFTLFLALIQLTGAKAMEPNHVEAELVPEVLSIQPGKSFWVALRLKPDQHWYTYWRNPGDVGLPTQIQWQLPNNSVASDIHWPHPKRFDADGMVSFGYDSEVLLLTEIQPPAQWNQSDPFPIKAQVFWLACHDVCIPGNAELTLELPVSTSAPELNSKWKANFKVTRMRIPTAGGNGLQSVFSIKDRQLFLKVVADTPILGNANQVAFLPYQNEFIDYSAPQNVEWRPLQLFLEQVKSDALDEIPDSLSGVIQIKSSANESAYSLREVFYEINATYTSEEKIFQLDTQASAAPEGGASSGLWFTLLLALAGGAMLNLMPCVFPVLSLKAISVVETAHGESRTQRLHGIAYTLGVMVFFAIVAAALLALRASGESIGWGFQLQSPWFVGFLAYLLFVMALSFSGAVELGTSLMGLGSSLAGRSGYSGSFFTGVLAVVVASPCSAPFMGTAIGFGLGQSAPIALLVFLTLGLGMALPFLLIAFAPGIGRILPKPGPWMDLFKQSMAFPLYLTVVWLLWVLGRQTGIDGVAVVLCGMILLRFALWVSDLRARGAGTWRRLSTVLMTAPVIGALMLLQLPFLNAPLEASDTTASSKNPWQPYSAEQLAELRTQGQPVFVNMTADWCITCLSNERLALNFPSVRKAFADNEVQLLKGDWTNRNPEITQYLQQFGREGVPLYVLYPAQPDAEPIVLPQILTPMTVQDALGKI